MKGLRFIGFSHVTGAETGGQNIHRTATQAYQFSICFRISKSPFKRMMTLTSIKANGLCVFPTLPSRRLFWKYVRLVSGYEILRKGKLFHSSDKYMHIHCNYDRYIFMTVNSTYLTVVRHQSPRNYTKLQGKLLRIAFISWIYLFDYT